jgi:Flp pilus assembly protein TadG
MFRNQVRSPARRGVIIPLTAILMVFLVGFVAFAVDLGYVVTVQTEMQRAADSAASAAAWDLYEKSLGSGSSNLSYEIDEARDSAVTYAASNRVDAAAPVINPNTSNSPNGDVVIGYLPNDAQTTAEMNLYNVNQSNAVQVTLHKTAAHNGEIALLFGRVFDRAGIGTSASATAAFLNNFSGFKTPSDGGNLEILPFALDEDSWNALMSGTGGDSWKWNSTWGRVESGFDGVREVNLYPQGTGSPGNRGTVDIGSSNNSTSDLARQIVHGISSSDLEHHGGELKFNAQGTLSLNGDTGISAGIKDELSSIIGQKRIIPIFQSVSGPGNNAQYVITKFVGVRILEVVLTGKMSGKRLMVQPANVMVRGGIPSSGPQKTFAVYSPVRLVH